MNQDELATALVLADATTLLLLAEDHAEGAAWQTQIAFDHRAVVHQATGMIMVQLGSTIAAAFARLQAHAYAESPTAEVATMWSADACDSTPPRTDRSHRLSRKIPSRDCRAKWAVSTVPSMTPSATDAESLVTPPRICPHGLERFWHA